MNPRNIALSIAMLFMIGSGLFALYQGNYLVTVQSFGVVSGWWAFWDRLGVIESKIGFGSKKLKETVETEFRN